MDWSSLHAWIGDNSGQLAWWQESMRAVAVFLYGVLLVRMAGRRIYGRWTPLGVILAVIIGSNLSRTITGNAPFVPTLAATAALVAVYWTLTYGAYWSDRVGWLLKGEPQRLVSDGRIQWRNMRRHAITEADLIEALHSHGLEDVGRVGAAYLERDGSITVVGGKG